jgi:hypothetical protein
MIDRHHSGMYGKKHSRATIERMRAAHKGQTPWNKGSHHSDETKLRMSLAQTGELNHNFGKSINRKQLTK